MGLSCAPTPGLRVVRGHVSLWQGDEGPWVWQAAPTAVQSRSYFDGAQLATIKDRASLSDEISCRHHRLCWADCLGCIVKSLMYLPLHSTYEECDGRLRASASAARGLKKKQKRILLSYCWDLGPPANTKSSTRPVLSLVWKAAGTL